MVQQRDNEQEETKTPTKEKKSTHPLALPPEIRHKRNQPHPNFLLPILSHQYRNSNNYWQEIMADPTFSLSMRSPSSVSRSSDDCAAVQAR